MDTLLLDNSVWDLVLDASGNIARASDPYAIAQDAASALRLFASELWYDTTVGVPYFKEILGHLPPATLMKAAFVAAALRVPETVSATCFLTALTGRQLTGQVQIKIGNGATVILQVQPNNFRLDFSYLDGNDVL